MAFSFRPASLLAPPALCIYFNFDPPAGGEKQALLILTVRENTTIAGLIRIPNLQKSADFHRLEFRSNIDNSLMPMLTLPWMAKLLLFLVTTPKRPRFSTGQLDKLADIFVNLGIILVASVILPAIISGLDKPGGLLVIWGIVGALVCWTIALFVVKEVKS